MQSIVILFYTLLSQGRQPVSHVHKSGFPKQSQTKMERQKKKVGDENQRLLLHTWLTHACMVIPDEAMDRSLNFSPMASSQNKSL